MSRKFAKSFPVTTGGENVIVVVGGVSSATVQVYVAGTGSTTGSALCSWTWNVCSAYCRPL